MSKFPEYTHEKSQEWFNRALNAIPSGVYGHLGPSEERLGRNNILRYVCKSTYGQKEDDVL